MWHAKVYPLGETPDDFVDTLSSNPPPSPPPPASSPTASPPPSPPSPPPEESPPEEEPPPPPPPSPSQSPLQSQSPALPPPQQPPSSNASSKESSSEKSLSWCFLELFPWCSSHESEEQRIGSRPPQTPPRDHGQSSSEGPSLPLAARKAKEQGQVSLEPTPRAEGAHSKPTPQPPTQPDDNKSQHPSDSSKKKSRKECPAPAENTTKASPVSKPTTEIPDASPSRAGKSGSELGQQGKKMSGKDSGLADSLPEPGKERRTTSEDKFFQAVGSPFRSTPARLISPRGDSGGEQQTIMTSLRVSTSLPTSLDENRATTDEVDGELTSELSPLAAKARACSHEGLTRGQWVHLVDDLVNAARTLENAPEEDESEENSTLVKRDDEEEHRRPF